MLCDEKKKYDHEISLSKIHIQKRAKHDRNLKQHHFEKKGPMRILTKEKRMNSDIYMKKILQFLKFSFFEKCVVEKNLTI